MAVKRGAIKNEDRAKQIKDFSGLSFGTITPTDIDLYIDYHNEASVFGEFKYGDAKMPFGQRLAIERACVDIAKTKPVLGILATHWQPSDEQIDCANAKVIEIWYGGHWKCLKKQISVRGMIERFLGKVIRHAV